MRFRIRLLSAVFAFAAAASASAQSQAPISIVNPPGIQPGTPASVLSLTVPAPGTIVAPNMFTAGLMPALYLSPVSAGTGAVPGDVLTVAGGTSTTAATLVIGSTKTVSGAIAAPGSGGTNGACTVTGTTGTAVAGRAQYSGTVVGGVLTGPLTVVTPGIYSTNPTAIAAEPVTGCNLTGAQVSMVMGVNQAWTAVQGIYSAVPNNTAAVTGNATGVTFNLSWGPLAAGIGFTEIATANPTGSSLNWFGGGGYEQKGCSGPENTVAGTRAGTGGCMAGSVAIGMNAIGNGTGVNGTNWTNLTAVGNDCMRNWAGSNSLGATCVGAYSLASQQGGYYETGLGYATLRYLNGTAFNPSTAVGALSCPGKATGSVTFTYATCLGAQQGGQITSASYFLLLGANVANTTFASGTNVIYIDSGKNSLDAATAGESDWIRVGANIWTASGTNVPATAATTFSGTLTLGGRLAWSSGLGAVTHVLGPVDQPLAIAAAAPVQATGATAGNAITLAGSAATAGSGTVGGAAGGAVTVTGGAAAYLTSGGAAGGAVTINGGAGAAANGAGGVGGAVNINGGGSQQGGTAGAVNITGGAQSCCGNAVAGAVVIRGGTGPSSNTSDAGGALTLASGAGAANTSNSGTGGASGVVSLASAAGGAESGTGGTGGASGAMTVATGAGGNATGASGTRTGGNSGVLTLGTGAAGTGASANGTAGSVLIAPGGVTAITAASGSAVTLAGTLTAASLSTVGTIAGAVCMTSGGLFLYESGATGCTISLEELKEKIAPVGAWEAFLDIMRIRPIHYEMIDKSIHAVNDQQRVGFGARQVNGVDTRLATNDGAGNLQAFDPNGILAATVRVVQVQSIVIGILAAWLLGLTLVVARGRR